MGTVYSVAGPEDTVPNGISRHQVTDAVRFHFCEIPRAVKSIKTESRKVAPEAGGGRAHGDKFPFGDVEKVPEMMAVTVVQQR